MSTSTPEWDYKLHQQLNELGAALGPAVREPSLALYTPMHPESPPYPVVRDLSYGSHPRHRLDVHVPQRAGEARPVLLFVHGGGFSGGDKSRPGEPFYDNIARWAVEADLIGVNMVYRLAPEFTYPAGSEDVGAAFAWIVEHIAEYGGDPARVVVMGHSAGAAHVATFVANPGLRRAAGRDPAGAILSSGIYDPTLGASDYGLYYGEDPTGRGAVEGLCATAVPLLVSTAEFDPPNIQVQTKHLLDALFVARGRFPQLIQAQAHNHFSAVLHVGTPEHWFTDRILRFVTDPSYGV